jgi:hypothetical protein
MDAGLVVAGAACIAMAAGHETIGLRWILPTMTGNHLPRTPIGPPSTSASMIRITWHVVGIFAGAVGGLLLTLALTDSDPRAALLRWFAAMWAAATVMAVVVAPLRRRNATAAARLPVPLIWLVVAALCWIAA